MKDDTVPPRGRWLRSWQRPTAPSWSTLRRQLPLLAWIGRLTTAAVVAYLLTLWLTDAPIDLTGALTALLVVQASAYSSVRMGIVRVGAVVTGVLVAVALSSWVGLTWWSLGMAIAASLLLAAALRLGEQALETPISAMLILGLGGQEIAAETRVVTTLIGAGVGVAFNIVLAPPVRIRAAVEDVRSVAQRQAESLRTASVSMSTRPITRGEVRTWLEEAKRAGDVAASAHTSVRNTSEIRRLNPRALGVPRVEPALELGLDALDHSQLAIRSLFFTMLQEAPEYETPDDGYGEEVRAAFSVLLGHVADCLEAFGALISAETGGVDAEVATRLEESLELAGEARAILTELLMVDARTETSLWLLRGSVLVAVEQVLQPLKLEDRARRWREREEQHRRRPLGATNVLIRDMVSGPRMRRLRSLATAPDPEQDGTRRGE